jgi:hypothetical protein
VSVLRANIREAAVSVLKAANTLAGQSVAEHPFNDRPVARSFVVEDFGAKHSEGNVTEAQELLSEFDGDVLRRYRFCVIAEAVGGSNPQRDRDVMCGQAEAALVAAVLGDQLGAAKSIQLAGYAADDHNDADAPIRRGLQVFEVTYITAAGAPSTSL